MAFTSITVLASCTNAIENLACTPYALNAVAPSTPPPGPTPTEVTVAIPVTKAVKVDTSKQTVTSSDCRFAATLNPIFAKYKVATIVASDTTPAETSNDLFCSFPDGAPIGEICATLSAVPYVQYAVPSVGGMPTSWAGQ